MNVPIVPGPLVAAVRSWARDRTSTEVALGVVDAVRAAATVSFAVPEDLRTPWGLGLVYEAALSDEARAGGAHYTPPDVAGALVQRALAPVGDPVPSSLPFVLDPACGPGAFLLAVAEALAVAGHAPADIVDRAVWGIDNDDGAVLVAREAVAWWAEEHGVRVGPGTPAHRAIDAHISHGDLLTGAARRPGEHEPGGPVDRAVAAGFDLVVGNPPFQGQLTGGSVRSTDVARDLREAWGDDVVSPYTDTAAIFLVAAVRSLAPGGRAALILPTSILGARDAAGARAAALADADLIGLWMATESIFDAAVEVCAPILRRSDPGEVPGLLDPAAGEVVGVPPVVRRWRGRSFEDLPPSHLAADSERALPPAPWSALSLAALGVPEPRYRHAGRIGDLATASAGFRDEYYGLVDHVREAPPGIAMSDLAPDLAPLITTGLIDPGACRWGQRPVSFARTRFARPVIDRATLAAARNRASAWASSTAVPKVVVATQTRAGEAAVDEEGTWIAGTPAIAVLAPPDRLWEVAAVICSPIGTVAALARAAGTGRAADGIRHRAATVLDLPLPVDLEAWRRGAAALQAQDRPSFEVAMAAAYEVDDPGPLHAWWRARVPWPGPG